MSAVAERQLECVRVIDGPPTRFVYEHDGRFFVVLYSPWLAGYVAYRSTRRGEGSGIPLAGGPGFERAAVLDRLEFEIAEGNA